MIRRPAGHALRRAAVVCCVCGALAASGQSSAPAEAPGSNLPPQRIGPNDLLVLSVYDAPEFSRTVRVGADGTFRLPMVERPVRAAGLLPAEVEAAVAEALRAEKLFVDPVVTVTVAEYQSRPVRVVGAVRNPVTFQASGRLTLLDALARAGGLSPEAGPEILVSRYREASAPPSRIPVKNLIETADPALNIVLEGGEEIRVPEAGKIFVVGSVRKPGAYPVRDEPQSSVLRILALAEGLAPFASGQAFIYRPDPRTGTRAEIAVGLRQILKRKAPDVVLEPGDIFYVPDNSGRRLTAAALERIAGFGAATASGILIWRR